MGLVTACRALSFCTAVGSQSMTLEDPTRQRRFQSLETERNRARYEYQSKIATFTSVHAPGHCIYQAVLAMFGLKHAGRLHSLAGWHAAGSVPRLRARTRHVLPPCHGRRSSQRERRKRSATYKSLRAGTGARPASRACLASSYIEHGVD